MALAALASRRPDIVLTDLTVPGVDGYALLAGVRHGWGPLPIVAMTASAERGRALALGFNGFLANPFPRARLLDMLLAVPLRCPSA